MQIKNSSEKFGNLREIYPRCVDVERRTGSLRIVENIFVRVTVRPTTVGELAFPRRFLGPPECLVWRDENCAIAISWREWNYTVPLWGVVIRSKHDCPTNRHFAVTLYPCVKRRRLLSTSFANSKLGRSLDHNSNRFPSKKWIVDWLTIYYIAFNFEFPLFKWSLLDTKRNNGKQRKSRSINFSIFYRMELAFVKF